MGLLNRLNRLERSMGVRGPCPECNGFGVARFARGMDSPTPEGCSMCGAVRLVCFVRIPGSEIERRRARLLEDS